MLGYISLHCLLNIFVNFKHLWFGVLNKKIHVSRNWNGPRREKTCLRGFANNTGADQPAHPRSLISAFVIRFWKIPYVNLLQVKFSTFQIVSVAEETVLKHALSETPKSVFVTSRLINDMQEQPMTQHAHGVQRRDDVMMSPRHWYDVTVSLRLCACWGLLWQKIYQIKKQPPPPPKTVRFSR